MFGSGRWRSGGVAATVLTLAIAPAAWAAPPQADPANPPAVSVTANGSFATQHPADGDTLTATPGTWSGLGNSYSYQWQRCATTAVSSCADVEGERAAAMTADSLFGAFVRVAVTATNADGSSTAYSAMTARLADEPIHRIDQATPPGLTGVAKEGRTLTLDAFSKLATASRPMTYQPGSFEWRRYATAGGSAFTVIATNDSDTYTPTPDDVGQYIAVVFRVLNGAKRSTQEYTVFNRVGPVAADTEPPSATADPAVAAPDGAVDGRVLQGARGSWSGAGPQTYAYQWLRCDGAGEACQALPGETLSQYTPRAADVGGRVRLRVSATNRFGTGEATSAPTAVIAPAPPARTADPQVAGTARDGQILAGSPGAFSGTAPISSTFVWERCDAQGNACENVPGATDAAYTLTPDDIGHRLRYKQVAVNAGGSAAARSGATPVVMAIAPAASDLPTISGEARDEAELTGTDGAWTGSPAITYARQWMRCSAAGDTGSCTAIGGATGSGYTAASTDVGSFLRLRVTASNFGNSVPAFSSASAMVVAVAPRATAPPAVSGKAVDGATLMATNGTWAGSVPQTYTRRWERCDGGCVAIPGATGSTYELAGADVGHRVRAVVVAAGPGGTTESRSAATDPIAAVAPSSTAAPELSGTAREGETLTATEGGWTGSVPMQRAVQWERCDAQGQACSAITGATGATRRLEAQDVGRRVRVSVRASNGAGEHTALSDLSAVVEGVAPVNEQLPAVSGTARDEETLTATQGTWTGSPAIAYSRQWMRCSGAAETAGCEAVAGATGASHRLSDDDVGSHLRVRVTATNAAGSVVAWSTAAGPVLPAAPGPLSGEGPIATIHAPGGPGPDADQTAPDVGDRIVATPGSWSGTDRPGHAMAFAYAWERCTVAGCVAVPGRTDAQMTVTAEDVGTQLRAVVTAVNPAGSHAQATARFRVTRGAGAPAPAVAAPPALPSGSLLTSAGCQTVGRRVLTVRAGAAGRVRLTVPAGTASAVAPLAVSVKVARPKALRKVTVRVGGKRVRLKRTRKGLTGLLRPQVLAGSPQLRMVATPRKGKPAKVGARLRTADCDALLSVALRGRKLSLRVDQRTPIESVTFTMPKGLALKIAGDRIGALETLPFGGAERTLSPARVGGNVALRGSTVAIGGLPGATATLKLDAVLSGTGRKGKALRFAAATTGPQARRLTVSVRR